MSNFPYNNDKYEYTEEINGSPLTFSEAENFAYKIMRWHSSKNTADWSESNDGFDYTVTKIAFGLIELLSDPNAMKRLEVTGKQIKEDVDFIMKSDMTVFSDRWKNISKMLNEELNK